VQPVVINRNARSRSLGTRNKLNGNKVARSDGAKPLMELPDAFPNDVDYDWYIREAESILIDIGYRSERPTLDQHLLLAAVI
ncbi:hypothetical protein, partial [Bradyrhizobium valentinum]